MINFNLDTFIAKHVTGRSISLLQQDILSNYELLFERINGKSALVIGGAGSIGSSFIKALLRFQPSRLVVVDINENGLTELTRDLRSTDELTVPPTYLTYPINFGDTVFDKIYEKEGPFDIVANFAAHKHVRSEKDQYSIEAMLENNVLRAGHLLELLKENPPSHFFCVSTDKATNPVNVMGASKKLMEEVILAYSRIIPITTARFANVAFSNGSLPAGFLERLMKKQPLSAPNDVKRYFVSPEESGQICLLACILGKSGEIFFPKLSEAHDMRKFSDIATMLLHEMGLEADYCSSEQEAKQKAANLREGGKLYPVYYFTSDTSGEKAFEEFYTGHEVVDFEQFKSLGVIKETTCQSLESLQEMLDSMRQLFSNEEVKKGDIVALIQQYIPNFEHIETGKGLDQKM
jgi:FlaA1/EpsC-like NDP-sugar epimerase